MIGIDILDLRRLEAMDLGLLKKRILNESEERYLEEKGNKLETLGGIYAAKEAVSKALGRGIGDVSFKDILISWGEFGQPSASYKGLLNLDLSISHEKNYAIASSYLKDDLLETSRLIEVKKMLGNLPRLKKRGADSHKGDFGKVAIVGGSKSMAGSVYLSSLASLRMGTGLSYTLVPKEIQEILEIKLTENIIKELKNDDELFSFLEGLDAIALGMGMGKNIDKELFVRLLSLDLPKIVDADGLNFLARNRSLLPLLNGAVITPHEMEMARLCQVDISEVRDERLAIAKNCALVYNCIVVLKGHETIVTDGSSTYINKTGSSALATAGSGDVLSGIIASNLGSGLGSLDASILSVFLHGLSGELAGYRLSDYSVIARDIISNLPNAIKIYERLI